MDISIPYYSDMSRISNSNIGWMLKKGPRYLKDMLDGKEEGLKLPQLEKGSMIHEYILQPDEFWQDYAILDFLIPKVKQQKDLLQTYSTSKQIDPFMSEEEALLYSYNTAYKNTKPDDKKIQEAKELVELYQDYIQYWQNKDSKKIISFADLTMLKTIKRNLQEHKKANELLYEYPKTFEVFNEFHINWEYPNASGLGDLGCKSLLDRVMIDHVEKKIYLIDLKTTSDIYNFKHSVEEFDYCRQLAYYWMAIHWYFKNELKIDISEYEYKSYIIGIQSHNGYEVRVFEIDPLSIENRIPIIDDTIKRIAWHKNLDLWDHTMEYYKGDGTEKL